MSAMSDDPHTGEMLVAVTANAITQMEIVKVLLKQDGWTKTEIATYLHAIVVETME